MAQNRLKRAESFLGIHFDFHAREDCKDMGKRVTPEMVENIIDLVKPGDTVEKSGFPCAIGANDADDFPFRQFEIKLIDCNKATEVFGYCFG